MSAEQAPEARKRKESTPAQQRRVRRAVSLGLGIAFLLAGLGISIRWLFLFARQLGGREYRAFWVSGTVVLGLLSASILWCLVVYVVRVLRRGR